ncbi:hypothetical protein V1294_006032 [Bradyrhizobium sp. AZCC 1678]|uniref:hypothetical protein n=1 Tax=Bradyrhizobium sp. AZCC 1678 TaxID=3117030 RepID=UPI002FEEBB73
MPSYFARIPRRRKGVVCWKQSPALARLIGMPEGSPALNAFLEGASNLSPEHLSALTSMIWSNAAFDAENNCLRAANVAPPTPITAIPPALDPDNTPPYHSEPAGGWTRAGGIKGLPPSPQARPQTRPGWAR